MNFGDSGDDSEGSSVVDASFLFPPKRKEPPHPVAPSAAANCHRETTPTQKDAVEILKIHDKPHCAKDDSKIRIVLGKSVLSWRRRSRRRSNTKSNQSPQQQQQQHVVLRQADTSRQLELEDSTLKVLAETKNNASTTSTSNNANTNTNININPRLQLTTASNTTYTAKKVRPPQQGGPPAGSSSSNNNNNYYLDAIAIWDSQKKVYVLEIPYLVATDILLDSTSASANAKMLSSDRLSPNNDPMEQLRLAEQKVAARKRKHLSSSSTTRPNQKQNKKSSTISNNNTTPS